MKHETKGGQAHFHVILKRRFAYYIISVYLPSLSLLMVTHWTNFISVEHFEANIMVHLTAMLVMYTLFQATSVSLPQVYCSKLITFFLLILSLQTAYVKLIDIWLLYGLTLPFLGFILSCLEEIYHEPTPTHTTSKVKPHGMLVGDQMKNNKQAKVQKLGRVVLPVTTVIFIILYVCYAVYSYFNPQLEA